MQETSKRSRERDKYKARQTRMREREKEREMDSVSVSVCERERNRYLFGLKFSRFDLTHKNVALRLKRNLRVRLSYIIYGHV